MSSAVDLTVVLNVHDEVDYLPRTLRSNGEAAEHARALGHTVELLLVADRPTPLVRELVAGYESSSFDEVRVIDVDHGSLGPSRAAGVAAARGEFVTLADADDLVSFNAFAVALDTARREGQGVVVSPEFVFIFDRVFGINHYAGSSAVSPLLFTSVNPFTSRVLAARDLLLESRFGDVPLGPGYAYEDWHLNCNLLASGARFVVAPETILFYRSRSGSLSSSALQSSTGQIPPSRLFEPAVFKSVVAASGVREGVDVDGSVPVQDSTAATRAFLGTARCRELLRAAGECDPAIAEEQFASAHIQPMRDLPVSLGAAYLRLCEAVGDGASFTDVVFAPGNDEVGRRQGVFSSLTQRGWIRSESRVLVIARKPEELTPFGGLRTRAPGAVTVVTIDDQDVADDGAEILCLKLIQSTGAAARIHVAGSSFGHAFAKRFGVLLQDNAIVSSPPEPFPERRGRLLRRTWELAGALHSTVRDRPGSSGGVAATVPSGFLRGRDLPGRRRRLRERASAAVTAIDRQGGWIARGGRLLLGPVWSARAMIRHRQIRTLRWSPRQSAWIHRWPEGRVADARRWEEWRDWAMEGESYDFEELMFSYYRPAAGDVVIDVGAGHGGETFALAKMVGPDGSVLAIEAAPGTYRRLEHLRQLNGWKHVETLHAAVSDEPGIVTISDGPDWVAANIFESGVTAVPAVTLDDLCRERGITRIDWLKMNIEGAEKEAIRGMDRIAPMIRNVTISCHDFLGTEWATSKSEVVGWLVAHGFSVRGREYDRRTAAHDYVYAWRSEPCEGDSASDVLGG